MVADPPFRVERARLGVDLDDALIRRGAPVCTCDGDRVGRMDPVRVEPSTGRVSHLVVNQRRRPGTGDEFVVPVEQVLDMGERPVYLRLARPDLDRLASNLPLAEAQAFSRMTRTLETNPAGSRQRAEHQGGARPGRSVARSARQSE